VHHNVVKRLLAQAGPPRLGKQRRSQQDPFLPFIHQTLEKFPALTASRLYAMVRERGYRGGSGQFRHLIACHRPRPTAEAYLRLASLTQVDWGHFGHLQIGRARRPLMAFVMVIRFHPILLAFAGHYRHEPRPSGNRARQREQRGLAPPVTCKRATYRSSRIASIATTG
jgi:hypothetical protein